MSYTKNRVTITTSLEGDPADGAMRPYVISGVVTNDKGGILANVKLDVENLYGSYKKTITTDDKGTFKITIDYNNDVNYLYKIEYHGDAENFGAVKTIPITYPPQHLICKIGIGAPIFREIRYEKGRYMPGDEIQIYPSAGYPPRVNPEHPGGMALSHYCAIDYEFNNMKSVMPSTKERYHRFVIPDVNVDNLNCTLKLTSRSFVYKERETDILYLCPPGRLEYTFDIIVVDKIKLKVIPYNNGKDGKQLVVGFYNIDGSPKQNWRLPYNLKFYVCHVDTNLDEHLFTHDLQDVYLRVVTSDENGEVFIRNEGIDIFNKWQFKPGDYIYAVYPGLVSNKLYLHKNGEWSDVKEDL